MTDNPITEAILAVKAPYPDCIAMHPATVCAWLGEPMLYTRDGVRDAQGNLRFFGILIRESRDVPERTFVFEQCNVAVYTGYVPR